MSDSYLINLIHFHICLSNLYDKGSGKILAFHFSSAPTSNGMTPRIFITIALLVHGLIHLMGFLKAWGFPIAKNFNIRALITLSSNELKTIGLLWLLCCIGLVTSCIIFLLQKDWWWMVGAVSLLLSQSLVVLYWHDAKYGTLVNVIILLAVLISYHQQRFNARIRSETKTLLASQINTSGTTVSPESIEHLPAPVQKWLIKSGVIGMVKANIVHLKQKGTMRQKPEGKWLPMEAEQYITANLPGFIWNGTMGNSFITINGRDKYINGKGNMLIKVMSTIPIGNSSGEEIDQGAMMRFLAEVAWVPSAALNDYIHWTYINDTIARATMTNGNRTVSGTFYFDYEGDIVGFEGKRYGNFNGHFSLETWFVRILEHKEFNGIRIGNKCEVTWKLKQGDFTWLQLEVTDISYNNTDFIKPKV